MTPASRFCAVPPSPMLPRRGLGRRITTLLGLWLLSSVVLIMASAAEAIKKSFDLPADAIEKSLKRFSEQSGLEVLFPTDAVKGLRTQLVRGTMTSREALDRMLVGTYFGVVQDPKSGALTVRKHPEAKKEPTAPKPRSPSSIKKKSDNF